MVSLWRSVPVRGLFILLLTLPADVGGQTGTVLIERQNFRAAPDGNVLAEIFRGTDVRLGAARNGWREATLEGWIWAPSVRAEPRDGHDLVVTAGGGENLRATPNGGVIARVRTGMLLNGIGARGNWIRVRRSAWIWERSLRVEPAPAAAQPTRSTPAPAAEPARSPPSPPPVADAPARTPRVDAETRSAGAREFSTAGSRGLVVLTQPAGDTLASIRQGASIEVLGREGDWARVRVEGWTLARALPADDARAVLRDIGREQLRLDPDRFHGRVVEWTVQFISLQQAEPFRTEFVEGEPFILARGPGDDAGFVYVAVPAEQVDEVQRLAPLQRIGILGRIRVARSPLTDAPVLDLLEIIRRGDAPRP